MWRCPKCRSKVDDSFAVCWQCGTTPEGVEDPDFLTADEAEPIEDDPVGLDPGSGDPMDDFAGTPWPELVECYMAENTIEAKFVADQLTEEGIPAIADRQDINMVMGGFRPGMWGYGPKVRVRPEDLPAATVWVEAFKAHRKAKSKE